jgi:hypothetical protein
MKAGLYLKSTEITFLAKAIRHISRLTRKVIIDKNGHKKTVYVRTDTAGVKQQGKCPGDGGNGGHVDRIHRMTAAALADTLRTGKSGYVISEALGIKVEIEKGCFNGERTTAKGKPAKGEGLKHIIEERITKNGMLEDDVPALVLSVLDTVRSGKDVSSENDRNTGYIRLEKGGIIVILSRKRGNIDTDTWLLTGFDDDKNKKQATETIQTVNAKYGYTPEFSLLRTQVGAVIASLPKVSPDSPGKSSPSEKKSEKKTENSPGEAGGDRDNSVDKRPASLKDHIHAILHGTPKEKERLRQKHFYMADTPGFMRKPPINLTGDYFTAGYGMIIRHQGKDTDHALTEQNWTDLCEAIKEPFAIAKHGDGFRLFTNVKVNGHFVMTGVDVRNVGEGVEVNSMSTAYGKKPSVAGIKGVIYTSKKITPEQSALLEGPNARSLPSAGVTSSLSPVSPKKSSPSIKKSLFFISPTGKILVRRGG